MRKYIKSHIKSRRMGHLPEALRGEILAARKARGWTQARLGKEAGGLPQMHISGIETGKIVPRYDTLLDLARVLGMDLVVVPRALVPAVLALIQDFKNRDRPPLEEGSPDSERGNAP